MEYRRGGEGPWSALFSVRLGESRWGRWSLCKDLKDGVGGMIVAGWLGGRSIWDPAGSWDRRLLESRVVDR